MFIKKITEAFTLTEIMITITIIGILSTILLPIAIQSAPDENIMKFKKGNTTLGKVIAELVANEKYYSEGDLGKKPDGSLVQSYTYFCKTFADVVNVKSINCSEHKSPEATNEHIIQLKSEYGINLNEAKKALDIACKKYETIINAEIELVDGIIFYQTHPNYPFGMEYSQALENSSDEEYRDFCTKFSNHEICQKGYRLFGSSSFVDEDGFDRVYKIFCMDIDGINKKEDPFGYGIRADGKIITGAKADEWIKKKIQGENE